MYKNAALILLLLSVSLLASGKKPLMENNLLKAEAEEMNAFKSEVKGDIKGIESKIGELQVKIDSVAQGNANAVAALKSDIKNTNNNVSGNQVNNDADLMWKIIYGLLGTIGTLIGVMFWVIKTLFQRNKEKKFYKDQAILRLNPADEDALEKLRQKHDKFIREGKL